MRFHTLYLVLSYCIAAVWFINGLFCKVLGYVPRHKLIVEQILGEEYAGILIMAIGLGEIIMAGWIISGYRIQLNALVQIGLVAMMNLLELAFVPELLLWGKLNSVFAFGFILLVYWHAFHLIKLSRVHC